MRKLLLILVLLCLPVLASADEITIGKQTFDTAVEEVVIDAARISSGELTKGLKKLPQMTSLSITGASYGPKQLASIRDTFPEVSFYAEYEWNNQTFHTRMTEASLERGKYGLKEIRQFLNLMTDLEKLDLFHFGVGSETIDKLTAEYPGVTFGWRMSIGNGVIRSDSTAFSMLNNVLKDPRRREPYFVERLRHFPQLKALDLGHNSIAGVSFLQYLPELRVLILADNVLPTEALADIVRYCPKLEYLEIFMNKIDDLSCLTALTELKHLNICANRITDISPILEMPQLERCWLAMNKLTEEQQEQLRQAMPQTHFEFNLKSSTEGGWREGPVYETVREMFHVTSLYVPFEDSALQ